jgi:hypothetical protein
MNGTYSQSMNRPIIDRRSGRDRRKSGFPSIKKLMAYRRRREVRRRDDQRQFVLFDHYSLPIVLMVLVIMVLSILDAALTLVLINHGAVELNPVMAYFLNISASVFMLVKYVLTAVSVLIILMLNYVFLRHINIHVRALLNYFAGIFVVVVVWELFLVARFVM